MEHAIGWLNMPGYKPETWNPVVGCTKVSAGCKHCYAERMARRIAGIAKSKLYYDQVITESKWNGKTARAYNQLEKPFQWKTPRMIFVCSMGDLFHETADFEWTNRVFAVMALNGKHQFIVLTKRPERMKEFMEWRKFTAPLANVWLGVSAENQEEWNKRVPVLNQIEAAVKIVSVEPMLGPIDIKQGLGETLKYQAGGVKNCISWVICGGESGPGARPMHPEWARMLMVDCWSEQVPFFFKQWGEWRPSVESDSGKRNQWSWICINGKVEPGLGRTFEYETLHHELMINVGREAAGDLLEGKKYKQWPGEKE
ncbi:MAG TPA: phage Gp37/Gp68 family protein [Prolixibacteraceae bacterium]|jgi:protein gp37|nr:phage Gp37/Gp68 family protein [Prolixibacteraceae bacterium]